MIPTFLIVMWALVLICLVPIPRELKKQKQTKLAIQRAQERSRKHKEQYARKRY